MGLRLPLKDHVQSEANYRTMLNAIDSGFCIIEMIFGDDGHATDYRIVEVNPAFERQSGLVDAVGRRIREFAPDLEEHWFERYSRVATTGEPMRVEGEVAQLGRWYDINAFRVGAPEQRRVGVLFTDITERRKAEDGSRESERQQAFLLRFSDALRAQPNDDAVVDLATRMLAEQLGLDRCYATAMYPAEDRVDVIREFRCPDLAPMPPTLRFSDFPEAGSRTFDRTLIFGDTANDPDLTDTDKSSLGAMSFGALLSSPVRRGTGNPIWALGAVSAQPRRWTPAEVALMEAASERTWAAVERARAEATLRESEARRELALEAAGMATFVWNVEEDSGEPDARMLALFGQPPDGGLNLKDALAMMIHPDDAVRYAASVAEAVIPSGSGELREAIRVKGTGGGWRWVAMAGKVSFDSTGRPLRLAGTALDITERRLAEQALRESDEQQAFLLKLSDALRTVADPVEVQRIVVTLLAERLNADRAYYVKIDEPSGVARVEWDFVRGGAASLAGVHRLADYGWSISILRRGEYYAIPDTQISKLVPDAERPAAAALQLIACVGMPLIKDGGLVAALCVTGAERRSWSEAEVDLVREVAERTWAAVERARAEKELRDSEQYRGMLLAELQHRVRNILALVRSIARRTASSTNTVDDYVRHLDGRLAALARVQAILTRDPGVGVRLRDLVVDELNGQTASADQAFVDGPDVSLTAKAAEVLSLAVHELATNSTKYGALSQAGARVDVRWTVEDQGGTPWLDFRWEERLTGKVGAARRKGFGTELITKRVPYELRGGGVMRIGPGGVEAAVRFPLETGGGLRESGDGDQH